MHQKERKMLKWLKQKPTGHHNHRSSQGSNEAGQKKIITDDPLATIQVHHPQQKKSKNKSEEIYAVSRVNPLFEEEDVPKVVVTRGNQSGSSGYDSGPTSDDDDLKLPHRRTDNSSTSSTSSFSVLSRGPPKHGQLFRDEDDPVVHHQAAILAPNGRPVLHIVEQNKDFVQSIAVAVGGRPLSPIDESFVSGKRRDANNRSTKVSVHPVPTRRSEDSLGVAKLIQKEKRFVHSIRLGSSGNKSGVKLNPPSSGSRVIQATSAASVTSRKPSVTFSERVELVAELNGNKPLMKGPTPYRRPSMEQDSIVTESLLLMTSSRPVGQELTNAINNGNNGGYNRLINPSKSASPDGLPSLRKVSTDSSNTDNKDEFQRIEDLEAFSSSLRKNHPVKHILSNSGKSLEINPAADHYSSVEFLDDHQHSSTGDHDCENDHYGQGHSFDTDETRSSSNEQETPNKNRCRRSRANCPKSPFGGIADHYAAAKEIAKEIESYSNGSAKSNSKKSIVRDLLSGRGRDVNHTAVRKSNHDEYHKGTTNNNNSNNNGNKKNANKSDNLQSSPSSQMSPKHSVHNDAIEAWESVRVQQIYLKGRTWKEVEPSSSSSSLSPRQEESNTGQRVMSVTQQGQVHSNKKDRSSSSSSSSSNNSNITIDPSTTTTNYASILQQSSSNNKQQQLKSSIYDGLSSEGASSNNEGDDDASSDSGNSTDRNCKVNRQDVKAERRAGPSRSKGPPVKPPDPSSIEEEESGEGLPSIDKVMIVTGDSKNMVVDLSGIPQDLRDAIISGSALITLPDGLKASSTSKGGYTIVSIPNSSPHQESFSSSDIKSAKRPPDSESEIKAIPSASVNVHKLERGELYSHIFNSYGTKNKTQIWDVMQQSVQQTLIEGENGKKKRITTVLPFHPNQEVCKSPDFTMEGQRMEHQRKKMGFAKKRRCVCRVFGILFFLATFIGVLVALSMIYTKGQRYFGSV